MESLQGLENLPPLPSYTLKPTIPLLPLIQDKYLTVWAPIVAYWVFSLFFHFLDVYDYFPHYRLHTPAELLKRNHVTKWEVVRDVVVQQVIQVVAGTLLGMTEPDDMFGKEDYDVAVWARRIRLAQGAIPALLGLIGVDAGGLAGKLEAAHPILAGMVAGGAYTSLKEIVTLPSRSTAAIPAFAPWEMVLAKFIYSVFVPAIQFLVGIIIVDTWQYFWHRAMHMNKWLYSEEVPTSGRRVWTDRFQIRSMCATTVSTFRTPSALCTTTGSRGSSWTSRAPASLSRLRA